MAPEAVTDEERTQLLDAIRDAEDELGDAQRRYLTKNGWRYNSTNPLFIWFWEKQLPDGRTVLLDQQTALRMQQALDEDATEIVDG
jgi:hypothetical protein